MRACVLTATGGIDKLDVKYVPDAPAPQAGEVRVGIRAAALNHLDLFVAQGMPGAADRFPHVVGADGAGIVESVGPNVATVRAGDRVMINPGISDYTCEFCSAGEHSLCVNYRLLGEHLPGTLAELVTVPASNVAPIPALVPPLSWGEAAAFSLVTLTAWRMLVTRARVQAGEWVLIWGIGGGVSLAALRVAKLCGARVIATSSSDAKLDAAKGLGADITLNHRTQQIAQEVRTLTKKRGVDVVVENVGAATWAARDVRRDHRAAGGHRPPAAVLAPLEHPGIDHGQRGGVRRDRQATGAGRAAADRGSGVSAVSGQGSVRAPGAGRAAGKNRRRDLAFPLLSI
jgi:NADPH:quinone reductase-like Zn-dependent oxidoreductase